MKGTEASRTYLLNFLTFYKAHPYLMVFSESRGHVIRNSRFHTSLKALAYPCAVTCFKQTRGPIDDPRHHFTGDEIKRFIWLRDLFVKALFVSLFIKTVIP